MNKLFKSVSTDNIIELNDLIDAGTNLVTKFEFYKEPQNKS